MSHPVSPVPVTGFRRRGRNALIGMTAAGLILGGPSVAFAAEAPAPESTGTFGQEVLPAARVDRSALAASGSCLWVTQSKPSMPSFRSTPGPATMMSSPPSAS